MYGLKKRSKQDENGLIQGAGTGTSDDVKKNVPAGSYIMPADSTQQIGTNNLKNMGSPTPVNLSNGEFQLSPDQVHSVGVQTLDAMKDQTHMPVNQPQLGFKPGQNKPELFFANGGLVPSAYPSADDIRRTQQNRVGGSQMRDVSGITRDVNRSLPSTTVNTPSKTSAPSASPNVRFPQFSTPTTGQMLASSAKNIAGGLAKTHGVGAMLGGAYTGMQTPTEDYRERFGFGEYNSDDSDLMRLGKDIGTRTLGVLSDVGNSASVGVLGRNFADKQRINAENDLVAQQKRYAEHNANKQATPPPATNTDKPANTATQAPPKADLFDLNSLQTQTATTQPQANPYEIQQKGNAFSYTNPNAAAQARANGIPELQGSGVQRGVGVQGIKDFMAKIPEMNLGMQGYGNIERRAQAPQRTEAQEAERQEIMRAASTPYAGSRNGQLTAAQLRVMADMRQNDDNLANDAFKTDANNQTAIQREAMSQAGATGRTALEQQSANWRTSAGLDVDTQKFNASNDLANRQFSADQLDKMPTRMKQAYELNIMKQYEAAQTPEEKQSLAEKLGMVRGQQAQKGGVKAVYGGQTLTDQGAIRNPDILVNENTGQRLDYGAEQLQPTQSNGNASYSEGQIYTDANGNKAVFRNGQFQPVK